MLAFGGCGKHLAGVGVKEGALDAGEVVLGELGDLVEELRAGLVIKEPGRELLVFAGEAFEDGLREGGIDAGGRLGIGGHGLRGEAGQDERRGSDGHIEFRCALVTRVSEKDRSGGTTRN